MTYVAMAHLIERANQVSEVVGSTYFHLKNRSPKSFVILLFCTEKVWENGGK